MDLTATEIRVLGCLIEKQRTTPDTYPLTLNALRMACNQSTARDPVVRYDDATVRDAMTRLSRRRYARLAGGGRAAKFRHLLDEALTRAPDELAVLCVLMLRGPQTPGELKQRADRLHPFADLAAVHETLRRLIDRELVLQLERRPGQKEERYAQRLGEDDETQSTRIRRGARARAPARRSARARPGARRRHRHRPCRAGHVVRRAARIAVLSWRAHARAARRDARDGDGPAARRASPADEPPLVKPRGTPARPQDWSEMRSAGTLRVGRSFPRKRN